MSWDKASDASMNGAAMRQVAALRDRYRGVLVGSAAGDALGATVEFMDRREIEARYGVLRDIVGGGWLHLEAGDVTDDTEMALCIAESIVASGDFAPVDVARRFVDWYQSDPPDIGNTTSMSLRMLSDGIPWDEAGQRTHVRMRPRDASNGSIMRCAPVALLARGDATLNTQASADSSRITHANPLAVDSCVALNAAIAALLDDPRCDLVEVAISNAREPIVRDALRTAPEQSADAIDASGCVLSTLQCAFWAVTTTGSLEAAVVTAVNLGQDADTTGAVAGSLAGAKWGYRNVPPRWLERLRERDRLIGLADSLLDISLARS